MVDTVVDNNNVCTRVTREAVSHDADEAWAYIAGHCWHIDFDARCPAVFVENVAGQRYTVQRRGGETDDGLVEQPAKAAADDRHVEALRRL